MQILRYLLFPFSLIYGCIILLRNCFYDWGWLKSHEFKTRIISVGNLEVGGSGKTPMVEYLIALLKNDRQISVLSRGYGRKTKGFRWVETDDEATQSGDEPLQIKQKFPKVSVAVCEDRVSGMEKIEKQYDLIVMDDAYQHRAVKPGLSILLFDYQQFKKTKLLLPTGNYREPFSERKRADILIITKTPENISSAERQKILTDIKSFPHQQVFSSSIIYDTELRHIFNGKPFKSDEIKPGTQVLLVTGIAKTSPLLGEIRKYSGAIIHHAYADHHPFTEKNMLKLVTDFEAISDPDKIIITTQKDAVKLKAEEFRQILRDCPIYEWPISISINEDKKKEFDNLIKEYAQLHQRIS